MTNETSPLPDDERTRSSVGGDVPSTHREDDRSSGAPLKNGAGAQAVVPPSARADRNDVVTDRARSQETPRSAYESHQDSVAYGQARTRDVNDPSYREAVAGPDTQQQPVVVDHDDVAGRPDATEETAVLTPDPAVDQAERDRAAEREARQRALGVKTRTEEPVPVAATTTHKRTTDRWHGSLAMHLLRWVTAAIIGIRGYQHLTRLNETRAYFEHSILPRPHYFALGVGIAECVVAVLLFFGLFTRFAGLLLTVIEAGMLTFFIWGKVNPFSARMGFNGELELLLATIGLLFLLLGSGGWGIDAWFRRRRVRRREEKAMGNVV